MKPDFEQEQQEKTMDATKELLGRGNRLAWFHCFSGIAGDMALGALLDAGADREAVSDMLARLPLKGWKLEVSKVVKGGISATHVRVDAPNDGTEHTHEDLAEMVEETNLPAPVKQMALDTFTALAEAEGEIHGLDPSRVHFHEISGYDTVVDVVGVAAALWLLGVDHIASSPVAVGSGTVLTREGLLPNPAPAVVSLLKDVPVHGVDTPLELTTPTGAAILAANAVNFGPLPPMVIERSGFGAGSMDTDIQPNVLQVVIGRVTVSHQSGMQTLALLQTNVDDTTGEVLGRTISELMAAGAYDAWVTPVVMKKGRPGYVVEAIGELSLLDSLREVMEKETGTFGVRSVLCERYASPRRIAQVEVAGMPVRIKFSSKRVKPEYDDAEAVATATGLPLREVLARAERAWAERELEAAKELFE